MEIVKLKNSDISEVVDLWYEVSIKAHDFIDKDYWAKNREAMIKEYLPNSETYLAVKDGDIIGFISMIDNYLAAIFVKNQMQGNGIGESLLNYIKINRNSIQLKVYEKNIKSINFYKKQKFKIISKILDENTNEIEFLMEWSS